MSHATLLYICMLHAFTRIREISKSPCLHCEYKVVLFLYVLQNNKCISQKNKLSVH